ncbi:MAG: S-layer homology domain-containing protein [Oscillibacter sp.]|nr:S-layer homology domain-containing protein [Oscillibacter sp.]
MKKQFIAKLLVLAMLLAMLPASALATSAGTPAGSDDPYVPADDAKVAALRVTGSGSQTDMQVGASRTLSVSASVVANDKVYGSDYYTFSYSWKVDSDSVTYSGASYSFTPRYTGRYNITCTVSAARKNVLSPTVGSKSVSWTIDVYQGTDFSVTGYVNNDTEDYYLGEIENTSGSSIIDQIDTWLTRNDKSYGSYDDATFKVTSGTDGKGRLTPTTKMNYLDEAADSVYFYLTSALTSSELSSTGRHTFDFTASVTPNYRNAPTYSVTISIIVDDKGTTTSSGDISYTAAIGDDVYFDVGDFEDFYHSKTSGGTLSRVSFDTVSGGTLYCTDGKLGSKDCYVNPTSRQTALDGVYFSSSSKQAKTVKIGFTAYGNKSNRSGTVTITYLNGEAKDITYSLNANGTVALKASDFTAAYKEVTNKTAPSGMTIVFQDVPSSGSLSYLDSSKKSSKEVTLRSSNIRSYSFTTRTSGSYQLGDVTYSGSSSRSDTINYIAYSGSTALFTGKVIFNGKRDVPTNLAVSFTCSSSAGVNFSSTVFNAANTDVMKSASYIRFGMPAHGSLTYGGSSATATNIYISGLGSVLYKPTTGFNGPDTVVYVVYDASNNNIGSGQVTITVTGNTTVTNNNGTNNGATSVDQFTDVPNTNSTAWYRSKLADLVSKGIMGGKGDGKFDPTGNVKNGEALKMILLAAGYPAQTEAGGNDWAINYKNLAVNNNLISSSVVLTSDISRDAVAELAAKALGLSPVTSGNSPFVDSNNGYAIALYNAGIVQGDTSSGSRKFLGSDTLQRAEICVIIYAMNEYVSNRYASTMPDGI